MRSSPQALIATKASRRYFNPVRLRFVVYVVVQFFQPDPSRAPGAAFRTRVEMLPIDAASGMTTAWLVIDATIRADTPALVQAAGASSETVGNDGLACFASAKSMLRRSAGFAKRNSSFEQPGCSWQAKVAAVPGASAGWWLLSDVGC